MSRYVGAIVGVATAVVFAAIGIGLMAEDRERMGALLLLLGVLRGGYAVRQWMIARS